MSFLKTKKTTILTIKRIRAFSLRTHFKKFSGDFHIYTFHRLYPKNNQSDVSKRTSPVISQGRLKGSLTIEAALVIPLFLFAIMAILSFVDILRLQMVIDSSMQQCAKELATYGYAISDRGQSEKIELPMPMETLFSELYVKECIVSEAGREYLDTSPLESEISFVGSRILEDDRIELYSTYYVSPFFSLSPETGFLTGNTAVVRAFTGYDNLSGSNIGVKEEYVYITQYGTAYHKDRGCPYLDLSIRKIHSSEVAVMRNKGGSIYYACDCCTNQNDNYPVFVTDYGVRYHADIFCSALRRTIQTVPISKVGGRNPCNKCVK